MWKFIRETKLFPKFYVYFINFGENILFSRKFLLLAKNFFGKHKIFPKFYVYFINFCENKRNFAFREYLKEHFRFNPIQCWFCWRANPWDFRKFSHVRTSTLSINASGFFTIYSWLSHCFVSQWKFSIKYSLILS